MTEFEKETRKSREKQSIDMLGLDLEQKNNYIHSGAKKAISRIEEIRKSKKLLCFNNP